MTTNMQEEEGLISHVKQIIVLNTESLPKEQDLKHSTSEENHKIEDEIDMSI
jgi:hypothetical protein